MSKQRPSFWRRRIFKNTFTRGGRLQSVKGWSVKIQHHGLRRTISLHGRSRQAAALEAQALYDVLVSQGWDAALAAHSGRVPPHRGDDSRPKTDARYWRPRLLHRKHSGAAEGWSARIEHAGTSYYFPLGTSDEKMAAGQAAEIYRAIAGAGWESACRRFSRELTLGFHWALDPVAWTYATVYTDVGEHQPKPRVSAALRIGLLEAERGLQRTLVRCLSRQASVQVFNDAQTALREIPRQRIDLVVANHVQFAQALEPLSPRLPIVAFSTYEDSNQLFLCAPGGAVAYLLKRTSPAELLAPIEGLLSGRGLSREKISEHVREYFYGASISLQSGEAHPWMGLLTPREKQILDCLSKGYVDKEIADELGISAWTVHGHVKNIFEKLEVHSRTAAVVKYLHK